MYGDTRNGITKERFKRLYIEFRWWLVDAEFALCCARVPGAHAKAAERRAAARQNGVPYAA
jgi:hypothetical protein